MGEKQNNSCSVEGGISDEMKDVRCRLRWTIEMPGQHRRADPVYRCMGEEARIRA